MHRIGQSHGPGTVLKSPQRIEAQAAFGFGRVQIVRRVWDRPIDVVGTPNEHRLEFAMLPRSSAALGCFPHRRGVQQFERFGEVFFFPAGQVVHARSQCRHQYSVVCSFKAQARELWLHGNPQWTPARLQAGLNISNPTIRSLLSRLGEELRCALSVRQLTRAFRTSRGRSIGRHIAECRIQQAKHLLASGLTVKGVAYQMGFSSAAALSTAFRRATGERPRDYLQAMRRAAGQPAPCRDTR